MAARRGKKKAVRRRKTFSITNALFSLGYANILSSGLFGTNIISFFTGSMSGLGNYSPGIVYGSGLGFKELVSDPGALEQVVANAGSNLVPMLTQSLVLGVTERLFKSVMRRPLGNVNRNIVKPLLGAGVRL